MRRDEPPPPRFDEHAERHVSRLHTHVHRGHRTDRRRGRQHLADDEETFVGLNDVRAPRLTRGTSPAGG